MEQRLPLTVDMQLDTAGAIQIARAYVFSCLSHILQVSMPTEAIEKVWLRIENKTAWGLRGMLGPLIHYLKPLLRLPVICLRCR